jgi:hypothetical protein
MKPNIEGSPQEMQIVLPSIIALVIGGAIVFAVLPRLAAPMLVGLSLVILVFALWQHVTLFKSEYQLSTWQEQLKFYAPFVMVGGLLLSIFSYFGFLFSIGSTAPEPVMPDIPLLPSPNTATNPVTAAINNGIRSATNMVAPIINAGPKNNGGIAAVLPKMNILGNANKNKNKSFFSPI